MSRFFKMPRFLRGSGNVSPTSGNVSLTYEDILTGFYARLRNSRMRNRVN